MKTGGAEVWLSVVRGGVVRCDGMDGWVGGWMDCEMLDPLFERARDVVSGSKMNGRHDAENAAQDSVGVEMQEIMRKERAV